MDDFKPLSPLLKDYYHLDLEHLPQGLQERIGDALFPISWGMLLPEQRQRWVEGWDYRNDPATEDERQKEKKLVDDLFEIERKITQWKSVATPTAQDLATQERTLEELEKQHAELEIKYRKMRGDYFGDHLETDCLKGNNKVAKTPRDSDLQRRYNNLLLIVAAMARRYGKKPLTDLDNKGLKSLAKRIAVDIETISASLDQQTIENRLREAVERIQELDDN